MAKAIMQVLHNIDDSYPDELKAEIFATIGDYSYHEVWGQEVLVAAFMRAPVSRGGIILSGTTMEDDDKWQSKCALVLAVGASALPENLTPSILRKWNGRPPQVGDWVYGNVQEHWHLNLRGPGANPRKNPNGSFYRKSGDGGWPCRTVLIADLRGRTTRPQDIM